MNGGGIIVIVLGAVLPLVITVVVTVAILRKVRAVKQSMGSAFSGVPGMSGGIPGLGGQGGTRVSGGSVAQAQSLQATGRRARARIVEVRPTGVVLNHINLQLQMRFRLEPLDGGAPLDGEKVVTMSQANMPRVGDVWPAWIDRSDPSVFAVAAPMSGAPEVIALFREFGIPHPLDPTGPAAGGPVAASGGGDVPPDERLAALERLAQLRRDGMLTDDEFEAEKRRILG